MSMTTAVACPKSIGVNLLPGNASAATCAFRTHYDGDPCPVESVPGCARPALGRARMRK